MGGRPCVGTIGNNNCGTGNVGDVGNSGGAGNTAGAGGDGTGNVTGAGNAAGTGGMAGSLGGSGVGSNPSGLGGMSGTPGSSGGSGGGGATMVPPTCYQTYAASYLKACDGGIFTPPPGCASTTGLIDPTSDGGVQNCNDNRHSVCAIVPPIATAACWVPNEPSEIGDPCGSASDCVLHAIPLVCVGNLCKKATGDSCSSDPSDCGSGFCDGTLGCQPVGTCPPGSTCGLPNGCTCPPGS